jgi:hypothetical protein
MRLFAPAGLMIILIVLGEAIATEQILLNSSGKKECVVIANFGIGMTGIVVRPVK